MKKNSQILIYCTLFLIPFYFLRFSILGIRTNIFEVGVLLSLISCLILICHPELDSGSSNYLNRFRIKSGMTKWLVPLVFLGIAAISVFIAPDKTKALGIFKGWFLVPIIFAWLITKTFNKKDIHKLSLPLYFSLLIISFWAILQKFGIISTLFYQVGDSSFSQYLQEGRSFGPFESPNFLAMFLVPMTFLSSPILEFIKTRWIRIVAVISFALPILALYFSNSRAGYITFVLCLLLFINYRFINLQKTKNRKPFFAAWFVLLFVVFNAGYLFFSTHNFKPDNNSDVIRVEIYKYSNTLLQQHPILGIGLGQFQSSIRELSKDNIAFQTFSLPYALHPHNLFLALWLNLGLAGLIVFILILVKLFQGLYFNDSKYKAYFIAAAFAILIHGLFDTTYFKNDLSAIFWLIFALSLIARSEE